MDKISRTSYPKASTINEIKLFSSFQSKITSAQNHEYLKLYGSSLEYYKKSKDLNSLLIKTQVFKEEPDLQSFQGKIANQLHQKTNLIAILKKIAEKESETKIEETSKAVSKAKEKEDVIKTINELLLKCKADLIEIQNSIKLHDPIPLIESRTVINEKSFIVTQIKKDLGQASQQKSNISQSTIEYLEQLRLKYKHLMQTLTKLLIYYNKENTLIAEKEEKKKEFEQLKRQYDELKPKHEKSENE